MADNNDDQYLNELLSSLRSSNSDGNEDLNDESDKDKKLESDSDDLILDDNMAEEDGVGDAGKDNADEEAFENGDNIGQDDFLNDIFSDSNDDGGNSKDNDDIFALEDNDNEEQHDGEGQHGEEEQQEAETNVSEDDNGDTDSLMELFNQINGSDTSEGDSDSGMKQDADEETQDDTSRTPDDNAADSMSSYNDSGDETAPNEENHSEEKKDSSLNAKAQKAEAAKEAKEAKAAAAKAAKEAKAEEKARKKAEKKAKKEQLKAEKKAKKDTKEAEDEQQESDVTQDNIDLINELYNDADTFNDSSDTENIPDIEDEPEEPKKKKEKKKKEPKPKKPKKEKVKKEKKAPAPSELIKVTKGNFIGMFITIVVIVTVVYFGTSFVSYGINLSQAKDHFNNGKYDQAFDSISGLKLRDSDKNTYYAIRTVASVYVDYCSYNNYNKVGMKIEALDSLIKGLLHYNEYYSDAEKYAVLDQYDAVKSQIVSELSKYGISEEDAVYYGNLENELQYREILMDIGGMTE